MLGRGRAGSDPVPGNPFGHDVAPWWGFPPLLSSRLRSAEVQSGTPFSAQFCISRCHLCPLPCPGVSPSLLLTQILRILLPSCKANPKIHQLTPPPHRRLLPKRVLLGFFPNPGGLRRGDAGVSPVPQGARTAPPPPATLQVRCGGPKSPRGRVLSARRPRAPLGAASRIPARCIADLGALDHFPSHDTTPIIPPPQVSPPLSREGREPPSNPCVALGAKPQPVPQFPHPPQAAGCSG